MSALADDAAGSDGAEPAGAPWLPPGRVVSLPGRGRTFIRELPGPSPDNGPTVVLLHGLAATADVNWFTAYEALGRRFRVVAMDHRGHGRGIRTWRPFRLEDCADDVAALADVLGLDRIIPVGYSMGGPIAQLAWRRHRDRVSGLVLCATARGFASRDPRTRLLVSGLLPLSAAARLTPAGLRNRMAETFISTRTQGRPLAEWAAAEFRRGDAATILQAASAVTRFRSSAWIGEVDVPTAVVVTARDQLVAPARQLRLAEAIPGSSIHMVEGDHAACVTAARRFVPALVQACTEVATRAAAQPSAHG
jgi:pimeloyl-ACP methyl ester carboxylesterase